MAAAPPQAGIDQCTAVAQFCLRANGWFWRNYANGYQAVGFWKDRGGPAPLDGISLSP